MLSRRPAARKFKRHWWFRKCWVHPDQVQNTYATLPSKLHLWPEERSVCDIWSSHLTQFVRVWDLHCSACLLARVLHSVLHLKELRRSIQGVSMWRGIFQKLVETRTKRLLWVIVLQIRYNLGFKVGKVIQHYLSYVVSAHPTALHL